NAAGASVARQRPRARSRRGASGADGARNGGTGLRSWTAIGPRGARAFGGHEPGGSGGLAHQEGPGPLRWQREPGGARPRTEPQRVVPQAAEVWTLKNWGIKTSAQWQSAMPRFHFL